MKKTLTKASKSQLHIQSQHLQGFPLVLNPFANESRQRLEIVDHLPGLASGIFMLWKKMFMLLNFHLQQINQPLNCQNIIQKWSPLVESLYVTRLVGKCFQRLLSYPAPLSLIERECSVRKGKSIVFHWL